MKVARLWFLLLVFAWNQGFMTARGASAHLERAAFFGKGYVRLGDWARANNFDVRWLKPNEILQLSNSVLRLVFERDSREAEFNGVRVCLSYPVVMREGAGYIADLDVETAIEPLLSPPKNWHGAKVRNIVIDPGHGGKDPGNQDGSHQEKKYALQLALELRDQLKRAGFNPTLTRTDDTFIDLPVRPDIARRREADLFISVHWNYVPGKSDIKGAQVFCLTPTGASSSNAGGEVIGAGRKIGNRNNSKNMLLAYEVQKSLLRTVGMEDHGVRRARFWVLRDAVMPAVLIEGGFMSNPGEAKRIYDSVYRRKMAQGIVNGILAYKQVVEEKD